MGSTEVVKEFRLDAVKVFRCRGVVKKLLPSEFLTWKYLDGYMGDQVLIKSIDGTKTVGVAKFEQVNDSAALAAQVGVNIVADVVLDYDTEERLLAETGQLGLEIDVAIGTGMKDYVVNVDEDGRAAPQHIYVRSANAYNAVASGPGCLQPREFDWATFFG